jgi:hypothetical protein
MAVEMLKEMKVAQIQVAIISLKHFFFILLILFGSVRVLNLDVKQITAFDLLKAAFIVSISNGGHRLKK